MCHLVFLSHSGADSEAALSLARRIEEASDAKGAGLEVWIGQRDLGPGRPWKAQLEDALERSTAFVVYVGSGGVTNWVRDEVDLALDRAHEDPAYPLVPWIAPGGDMRAIPGLLRQYQGIEHVDTDGDAFARLLRTLLRRDARAEVVEEEHPFQGLHPFTADRNHLFWGRRRETGELIDRLSDESLIMMIGDSGSGKSSLVKAGLVPAFRGSVFAGPTGVMPDDTIWHVVESRPLGDPFGRLAEAVGRAAEVVGRDAEARRVVRGLIRGRDPEDRRSRDPAAFRDGLIEGAPVDAKILLVVDQFEELFTLGPESDRGPFVDALMAAAAPNDDRIRVVLTMRRDYYNLCADFPDLFERLERNGRRGRYMLRRMSEAGLRQAIVEPLRLAGVGPGPRDALADAVLRDVGDQPGELALLEMALTRAWELRHRYQDDIRVAYEKIGRVEGALANAAEAIFQEPDGTAPPPLSSLSEDERDRAESLFSRLVRLGDTAGATRRLATRDEFDEATWALAQKLAQDEFARLVVIGQSEEAVASDRPEVIETVELAHEALVTQWPRYQRWLQNREGDPRADDKRLLDRLMDQAKRWSEADPKQKSRVLATGSDLEDYAGLSRRRKAWLSENESGFVRSSLKARQWAVVLRRTLRGVVVLLAAIAILTGWNARSRAEDLRDRLLLTAAERALVGGDRTHARLFLQEVDDTGHQTWRRLAFSLGTAEPATDWQAEEWLLGESAPGFFVTQGADGWLRQRRTRNPAESTRLRWPVPPSSPSKYGGLNQVWATEDGGIVVANLFRVGSAVWKISEGEDPLAVGVAIEVDPHRGWLLVFTEDQAELRSLGDPREVLASVERATTYSAWSDAGPIVNRGDSEFWVLGPGAVEKVPFPIYRDSPEPLVLDSAVIEIESLDPAQRLTDDLCHTSRLHLLRIGGEWQRYRGEGGDEWEICDSLKSPTSEGNRTLVWAPGGLLILEIQDDLVHERVVDWQSLPGCGWHAVFGATCSLSIDSDGAVASVSAASTDAARDKVVWRVDLATGEVTRVEGETVTEWQGPRRERYKIFWRGPGGRTAALGGPDVLTWAQPQGWPIAAAPRRLDLPRIDAAWGAVKPVVVFADSHLVAGYPDIPLVRHWRLPESKNGRQQGFHQTWWLRDGHQAGYQRYLPDGRPRPTLRVDVADPIVIEPSSCWAAEPWLTHRVVLSADGRSLLMTSRSQEDLVVLELRNGSAGCAPVHPDLRGDRAGDQAAFILDDSGRWVALAGKKGLWLWPTNALESEGERLSETFHLYTNVVFSPDGNGLQATGVDGATTRWRLSEGATRTGSKAAIDGQAIALDNEMRYQLVRDKEAHFLLDLEEGTRTALAIPNPVEKASFGPSSRYLAVGMADSRLRVWEVADPGARPLSYSPRDPFDDFRWVDESRLALLLYDGTAFDLYLDHARLAGGLGKRACALPAARVRWLEETRAEALRAYGSCARAELGEPISPAASPRSSAAR